jgi:hypothetical protein
LPATLTVGVPIFNLVAAIAQRRRAIVVVQGRRAGRVETLPVLALVRFRVTL